MSADAAEQKQQEKLSKGEKLQEDIQRYYLPQHLVKAITEIGAIPEKSEEALVGVGFLDIADYTFLSKFLSAKENQTILNGLYSAFDWVLKKHGGYLNKIEGDSLMFQYGGPIDPRTRGLNEEEIRLYISTELFYTCIELQRVCNLFNQANDKFLYSEEEGKTKESILEAFDIISGLRNNEFLSPSINALFQIRIRVGASIGKVQIGNFGPDGSKHWDIIGMPVIYAKRMESTAPIGGLRISEEYYRLLDEQGIIESYHTRFKRESSAMFSDYRSLLQKDEPGASRIIIFLQYYRGNQYVINKLEELFDRLKIHIRKEELLKLLLPGRYRYYISQAMGDEEKARELIHEEFTLKDIMDILGELQDAVKHPRDEAPALIPDYPGYADYFKVEEYKITTRYDEIKNSIAHTSYFYNLLFPLFFRHIKSSVLEYQQRLDEVEDVL
ncbi:MAG: hypothetical protein B6241_08010 [Spirochaetaceae bacterium 4572_59]|nr:MAG: hypothetical protein B6241_08010 [Spirochaetaceae bacterium 4572_59]